MIRKNVDLLQVMEEIGKEKVLCYQKDLEPEVEKIKEIIASGEVEQDLLWLVRKFGTWLFTAEAVYTENTFANVAWKYYEKCASEVSVYAIHIHAVKDGVVYADIEEISYMDQLTELKGCCA